MYTWCFTDYFFRDSSDLRKLITSVLESLKSQKVVYAEILISVGRYLRQGIPLTDIKTCLDDAEKVPGIRVQWIVDLVRDSGSETALTLQG